MGLTPVVTNDTVDDRNSALTVAPRSFGQLLGPLDETQYYSPVEVLGREAAADFLWHWLRTENKAYTDLYLGICLYDFSSLTTLGLDDKVDWRPRVELLVDAVAERHPLDDKQRAKLRAVLEVLHAKLPEQRRSMRELQILFLGDCLFEEAGLFVAADALRSRVLLRSMYVNSKNPNEQRRQLKTFSDKKLGAVFYSPFTYAFHPDFERLLDLRNLIMSVTEVRDLSRNIVQAVRKNIDFLANTFECPIFVSNASMIVRGTRRSTVIARNALTLKRRLYARDLLNFWLREYVASTNERSYRHLYLLDEAEVAPFGMSQVRLGAYLHTLSGLHPTRFSQALGQPISDRVVALSLMSRKIVICDLDNTLWEGVIGEGHGVQHYTDRQDILRRLKTKGVVLAIASKNDPTKVRWTGGLLNKESFVAEEVSWGSKVSGIQRIFQQLNLKPKDGIFIDDRPDERELVNGRWPEMFVADPCDERTWRIFSLLADLLDDEQEFDRTQMYQQREQREGAVTSVDDEAEAAAMFGRLELQATLRKAGKSELKRVSELINRTNQWNLAASRASFREVQHWSTSPQHVILTVQVNDKFGSMGTVCVAVVQEIGDYLEIIGFVLSCRVFGFGVETLLLDYIKRLAVKRVGAPNVRGHYIPTEHNAPCKDMYRDHGFRPEGDTWIYARLPGEKLLPPWFKLSNFEID